MTVSTQGARIALVTGGAGGLGLATADRFAAEGIRVVVADLDAAQATRAAAALPGGTGQGHRGIGLDVTREDAVAAAFEEIESTLGPVAILGCFAGILGTSPQPGRTPLAELSVHEWDKVNAVNARGTFLCIRELARRRTLRPAEHGRVITIASLAGQQGGLAAGAAYSASKGAVLALTKLCARELAPLGITVNAIAPGPIDTDMLRATLPKGLEGGKYEHLSHVPLGRVGLPREIAAAAAWLASPDAGYVTGSTVDVNGGLYMR